MQRGVGPQIRQHHFLTTMIFIVTVTSSRQ
jgi:hypothetical protein